MYYVHCFFFFFSSRRRHTRFDCDWSSDVCSSDLDVNAKDNMGKTTLHYAAWKGHDAVVRLLLEHKAKDNNGWTALHWAAENGQEAVVRLLLRLQIIESMIAHQSSSQRMYYGDKQSGSMSRCLR